MQKKPPPTLLTASTSEFSSDLEEAADNFEVHFLTGNIEMHRLTGAFADPWHESAFAAGLYRQAFACHILLGTLLLVGSIIWVALVWADPDLRATSVLDVVCTTLGLVGRVLVHRKHDLAHGQRIGSWIWTALIVAAYAACLISNLAAPTAVCGVADDQLLPAPLLSLGAALANGSQGIGFLPKSALIGLMLTTDLVLLPICGKVAAFVVLCDVVSIGVGSLAAHSAELYLRVSYAEKVQEKQRTDEDKRRLEQRNEQLHAEKERLLYDMQRPGRPFDDDDDRSAIRRGLKAGPCKTQRRTGAGSSEAGGPAESSSASELAAYLGPCKIQRRTGAGSSEAGGPVESSSASELAAYLGPCKTQRPTGADSRRTRAESSSASELAISKDCTVDAQALLPNAADPEAATMYRL